MAVKYYTFFLSACQHHNYNRHKGDKCAKENICIRHKACCAVVVGYQLGICKDCLADKRAYNARHKHLTENSHALQSAYIAVRGKVAYFCSEHRHTAKVAAHHQQTADKYKYGVAAQIKHSETCRKAEKCNNSGIGESFFVIGFSPECCENCRKDNCRCHNQHIVGKCQTYLVVDNKVRHINLYGNIEDYKLPQATETNLGGVKASPKTDNDTVEAKIGADGKLYVPTYPEQNEITVDSALDKTSTNPVQNKAVAEAVERLSNNKLNANALPDAINTALTQAKESGEFDGADGKTAYQYAKDGGYTGTEEEFAQKMAKELPTKLSDLENDLDLEVEGTVEITDGEPTKESTVMTLNPNAEEVNLCTEEDFNILKEEIKVGRIEKSNDDTVVEIEPNKLYVFPEMTELSYTLSSKDKSKLEEYHFIFQSGATPTEVTHPEGVKIGDFKVEANKIYEVSILEGLLLSQSWAVE